ncbi:uncharacterized protein LOC119175449 [Rhipicephalus microplus]|uniref:uncharacterized protein LOC119175449 n=1 Tax=Rhipicephalus microplus TaxID=6941 RepID=UPI003F6AECA0
MSNDHHKNPGEETNRASLQTVSRIDESCAVPSSLPSGTKNSVSSEINDELQFMNASLKCSDGIVARSPDDRAPSLSIPALLSDFVDESADNFSQATPTGSSSENRNNGPVCRICHGGDQEGALESLCSCAGTMGFVHVSCLELWLNAQKVDYCELCGQRFPMEAQPCNVLRFFHWVSQSNWHVQRMLLGHLLFLMMLITLSAFVFFLVHLVSGLEDRKQYSLFERTLEAFYFGMTTVTLRALYKLAFDMLSKLYADFLAWKLENPVLRIARLHSDRAVHLAKTK